MRPDDQRAFANYLGALHKESDRGLALIGAAFIDERLGETLRSLFATGGDRLLEGGNAPLGTFSARIELCLALGLIDEAERRECDYIRKIRNEFAHKVVGASFAEQRIADLCGNLTADMPDPEPVGGYPARFRFEVAVVAMASRLFYRPEYVALERRKVKTWIEADQIRWRRIDEEPPPTDTPVLGIRWKPDA